MEPMNPDAPKLTKNDQAVLKTIIEHARIPDTDIAKRMGISPQAVFKIRKKLEARGVIKGYQPIIDFKKLGIHTFALVVIELTPEVWEQHKEEEISQRIKKIPHVIAAYRVLEANASHVILFGFKDLTQMDRYLSRVQTRFAKEVKIRHIYPFSTEKIITQSTVGLLYEIIDKKEFPLDEFFLRKK